MNALTVGFDKTPLLHYLPKQFLLIDDGPLIDQLDLPHTKAITFFDVDKHTFNPLKDIDYRRAREFLGVLDAVFPEGANTLTKRYSNFQLLTALLSRPKRLDRLIADTKETQDAYQKIQTLLLSPVLSRVLNNPTNMSFKGTIIARLDRAVLGDFDCFVLANLLISQYAGTAVIPDFGFYASPFHVSLIRQDRLVAGISTFEEVPTMKHQLLSIHTKVASHASSDDAEILALYCSGFRRGSEGFASYVEQAIRPQRHTVPESEPLDT
jgi:hypothetical protein